jgi:hypothetical protein
MFDFLGKVYQTVFGTWLFSDAMSNYMWGFALEGEDTSYMNKYVLFWAVAIIAAFLLSFLYYKIIDKDSWARLGRWFLFGIGGSLLVMACTTIILWDQWETTDSLLNKMSFGPEGDRIIDFFDLLGAGFAQFLITFLFFFLFSILMKRFSYNCRYIPF